MHPSLIGALHHKHSLMRSVHCWGLQHICSLPSGRVEQKTKGSVGILLACPRNLERQVWLRKGTATYVRTCSSVTHMTTDVLHNSNSYYSIYLHTQQAMNNRYTIQQAKVHSSVMIN